MNKERTITLNITPTMNRIMSAAGYDEWDNSRANDPELLDELEKEMRKMIRGALVNVLDDKLFNYRIAKHMKKTFNI